MSFADLGLSEPILRAIAAEGYTTPTPIQTQAIPHVLAGRDLLGCAQTGTGKTAAFALPMLHRLHHTGGGHRKVRTIRALVLSPTRELASQIGESFQAYGRHTGLKKYVIYGGVGQNPQVDALHNGTDILVATPGRLLDLMNQGHVDLRAVEIFVLDEADRMLDMGFINDIRKIVAKVPTARQTLFFSATMPADIRKLADSILKKPVSVQVAPESAAADNVEQSVYHLKRKDKPALLAHLLRDAKFFRSLVFTRTKSGANRVVRYLDQAGIASEAIHGNKSQSARMRAIENFKTSKTHVLVATDIAARGLDIDDISHVVNFDIPNVPETYVHRIGRTARAGASGVAVSFCDSLERSHLRAIERLIRKTITVNTEHPEYPEVADSHEHFDRSVQSPPHRPNRPKQAHGQSRAHASTPSHRAPAARRNQPSHSKQGNVHIHQERSEVVRHGQRDQQSRPAASKNRGATPNRDSNQRPAAHGGQQGRSHAKPGSSTGGAGHQSGGRRRNRRRRSGRGAGPRR
ncbi:MAG: DEAD/DEAH box helicase [Planctomycetes bacterium]|nr:DEAD/DEAH box helicase [Planctomycetota bacterium]